MTVKGIICAAMGILGAAISKLFSGWDAALTTLVIFMGVDYVTGIILAGVFHKSRKSVSGGLKSTIGWQGICKKCVTLAVVLIAARLDMIIGSTYIRDAVVIAFCTNELISIIENAGLMGIPMPSVIRKAVDILRSRDDGYENY